jgi:hypothetical protein
MEGTARQGQGTGGPPVMQLRADLCAQYAPFVVGGWLDPWTYVQPGASGATEWPCPGVKVGADLGLAPDDDLVLNLTCTCRCHRGEFEHELPPRRTAVHPTEVSADNRKFYGGGG